MTYLDLINQFWQKDYEYSFSADEVNMYFRLLKHANVLGWKKPRFNMAVDKLMLEVGLKTKRPFDSARKGLRDAGLIDFVNGNGRGCTTEYHLIGTETIAERDVKNNPLSAPLSATIPQSFREENVPVHKSKIKNKKIESNDSTAVSEKSASAAEKKARGKAGTKPTATAAEIAALPLPHAEAEFVEAWHTFYSANTRQAGKPLSAFELMLKKLGKRPAGFAVAMLEAAIQGNWSGVENTGTDRAFAEWQTAQVQPLLPRPMPQPLPAEPAPSIVPSLNPTVVSERDAQRATEAAAHRQDFRNSRTPDAAAVQS